MKDQKPAALHPNSQAVLVQVLRLFFFFDLQQVIIIKREKARYKHQEQVPNGIKALYQTKIIVEELKWLDGKNQKICHPESLRSTNSDICKIL